jgi:hypothetical protein
MLVSSLIGTKSRVAATEILLLISRLPLSCYASMFSYWRKSHSAYHKIPLLSETCRGGLVVRSEWSILNTARARWSQVKQHLDGLQGIGVNYTHCPMPSSTNQSHRKNLRRCTCSCSPWNFQDSVSSKHFITFRKKWFYCLTKKPSPPDGICNICTAPTLCFGYTRRERTCSGRCLFRCAPHAWQSQSLRQIEALARLGQMSEAKRLLPRNELPRNERQIWWCPRW